MNPPTSKPRPAPSGKEPQNPQRPLPTVAVILQGPVDERFSATLRHLAGQSLPPREVLVISEEVTCDAAEILASSKLNGRIISRDFTAGESVSDTVFKEASGEYIQFLNTRDSLSFNKLECQALALEKQEASLACCPWMWLTIDDNRSRLANQVMLQSLVTDPTSLMLEFLHAGILPLQACLFRRSFLQRAEITRIPRSTGEQLDFAGRVLSQNPAVAYTAEVLALCSQTSQSPSAEERARFFEAVIEKKNEIFLRHPEFQRALRETDRQLSSGKEQPKLMTRLKQTGLEELLVPQHSANDASPSMKARAKKGEPMTGYQLRLIEELGFTTN